MRKFPIASDETLDSICGGNVKILQRRAGYRFNLDPILLAHFAVDAFDSPEQSVIDLGTGSLIIPLVLRKLGQQNLVGLELQPSLYALARKNLHLNESETEITLVLGDIREVEHQFEPRAFSQVICNPPYRAQKEGKLNPDPEKAIARHQVHCSLEDVIQAARYLLKDRGGLSIVYPATRLTDAMASLHAAELSPKCLRMVHPHASKPANLILLHALKRSRSQLTVMPPLIVHQERSSGFHPEVQQMLD